MNVTSLLNPRAAGLVFSLLLLCSCATTPDPSASGPAAFDASTIVPASQLPAEVTMNKDAGRGNFLFVTLRLKNGEELPFVVDTGAPGTTFHKSLATRLGKRLDTTTITMPEEEQESGVYAAPKLYLEGTPLMTGTKVHTLDFKRLSSRCGHPIMGLLGMDCLRHYCIQLDFEAGKTRFLNPDRVKAAELGKSFPLRFSNESQDQSDEIRPYIHHTGLLGGTSTNSLIDTGQTSDGSVEKSALNGHFLTRIKHFLRPSWAVGLPQSVWDGETYTNLFVDIGRDANQLGLRFLARHLVTFDFPNQTMYLNQTSAGPLKK
jgi:hypothetical protein